MDGRAGPEALINGRNYLYFAGTGYFSLHTHAELIRAANEASLKYGIASATSRVMAGTTPLLLALEQRIASFFGTGDAVYLPSGYLTNIAGLKALDELGLYDIIFMDEGSHYSLVEGGHAAGRPLVFFSCRNVDDLESKLKRSLRKGQRPLIASDGLFPVQAKLAPLEAYLEMAERLNGIVWIDDAHGVGILGQHGGGVAEHLGLRSPRLYMGATLSKAFGAYGGMIPGDRGFIGQVRKGSVMTGSSAPMHAAVAAGIKGIELVEGDPGMRERLWDNARYLKAGLKALGIPVDENCIPVVAFTKGNARSMKGIQRGLMEDGIFIQYTCYRGAGGEGVLRIVVFSTHTRDHIDRLLGGLKKHASRLS